MAREWSKYQRGIFNFVKNETGNAIIDAVAGSGKSTTICECMNLIPRSMSSIFLAFNKTIATELSERGLNAKTFHSVCFMPVKNFKRTASVNSNKMHQLFKSAFSKDEQIKYMHFCVKLVGYAKNVGIGCLVENTELNWLKLVDHHGMILDNDEADLNTAILNAQKLLRLSVESTEMDFDDMLYHVVLDNLSVPKYDFIFVDEAQDTNAIQRAILKKMMKPKSRIIAVGDPHQAIYGFRGASHDSLGLIASTFDCKTLPLSVSYRCGSSIIDCAKVYVPHIEARPNAHTGEVKHMGEKWEVDMFKPKDLILCRLNQPLISLAYAMLAARIPCYIVGKEFGETLKSLVNKFKARDLKELSEKLDQWAIRQISRAEERSMYDLKATIEERVGALSFLINEMPFDASIEELNELIDDLFADKPNAIRLSSIHRAKGLEAETVYWLKTKKEEYFTNPEKFKDWQINQEYNLRYVAITRAIEKLTFIMEKEDNR